VLIVKSLPVAKTAQIVKLILMKRIGVIFIVLLVLFILIGERSLVEARNTCDACGYCDRQPTPGNWQKCAECLYPKDSDTLTISPYPKKVFTVFGCLELGTNCPENDPDCVAEAGASFFTKTILNLFRFAVGGLSFLAILFGGLKVILARGDTDAVREGKRYVYGAILGLIVVMFSVLIVKIIGYDLLQIPFF
jgi:hypothetical protein